MPDGELWSADETKRLLKLWSTMAYSANQIGGMLGRTRSAICGKIGRLRRAGAVEIEPKPGGAGKKFAVNPRNGPRPKRLDNVSKNKGLAAIPPPLKLRRVNAPLNTHPCALIELEPWQCHWPLGDMLDPPLLFCGAAAADGLPYCDQHARIAYQREPHTQRHGKAA